VSTVWTLLSWSIIRELLPFDDIDKINYYLTKCYNQNLSVRKLQGLLKSQEYERLPLSTKAKLITKEQLTLKDTIPNPIIIDNPNNTIDILIVKQDNKYIMKYFKDNTNIITREYKEVN